MLFCIYVQFFLKDLQYNFENVNEIKFLLLQKIHFVDKDSRIIPAQLPLLN